jgi:hypothetical protein
MVVVGKTKTGWITPACYAHWHYCQLDLVDFLRLGAFIAHFDGELDALAFVQVLEPVANDGTEVYEHIAFAAVAFNETIALLAIEPFHRTGFFGITHDLELLSKNVMPGLAWVPNQDWVFLWNFCCTTSKIECT